MPSPNKPSDDPRPPGGTSRHPADSRPPGGTSRHHTPGTRTPRKVQWHDYDSTDSALSPTHALDEHGLNEQGFKELTEALERHRKGTPLKTVHYYPPQEDASSSSSTGPDPQNETVDEGNQTDHTDDSHYPSSFASSRIFGSSSSQPYTPPTHEVPDNYINEDEDAGLPGTKDLRNYSRKKARDFVRTLRRPSLSEAHEHKRKAGLANRRRKEPNVHVDRDKEKDVENGAAPQEPRGGGILSTLLNLYQHPDNSGAITPTTMSSQSSRRSSFDGEDRSATDNESDGRRSPRGKPPWRKAADKTYEKLLSCKNSVEMPNIFGHVSRPAAARSAGGVFGPLIASTGNLTGVAAPQASQLQPNLKRPGYKLSRYSIETKPDTPKPPAFPAAVKQRDNVVAGDQNLPTSSEGAKPRTPMPSPVPESFYQGGAKRNLSGIIGGYASSIRSGRKSGQSTPGSRTPVEALPPEYAHSPRHNKRHKRKKAEVYITRHVAHIIQREEFLMKLTRAMMMFGGPAHRLQSQMMSAARVLDIQMSVLYLPDIVLLSFDDDATGTSHIKLIRQSSAMDLGKLKDAFSLYWKVIHDKLSVSRASLELDVLMKKKPQYNRLQLVFIGGMCSAAICTVSFSGSFIDALVSFPLGAILVLVQIFSVRNVLFTYVFEVTMTTVFSFIAGALAETHKLCYSAILSSSIVLILPGFLVLNGSLELMSRQIVSGSVRLLFAVVYALFLGFGFTIGAEFYELITSKHVNGADDFTCSLVHDPLGPWYQRTPSVWWAFLTVPMYSLFLSLRNQAPWNRKEMFLLIAFSCVGWVTNYFTGRRWVGQSDIIAAVGAFAVGLVSNLYSRIFSGNAFVVMITGILFQLPSGLGKGGLLTYVSEQTSGSGDAYLAGFRTALKIVSVGIGITIGLGLSLALTHPIQSRKREAGIFSL
ncbi:hypothetical protein M413DRAFT_372556 [Hebeloma cylindrosporum]|uniref:Threonine/serine exporter-like N-terminal domain-containing protein n=1 Tax=Hebeloma cylindrosporum TaxID=76867 RepID=A0A0C2YSI5_HEBCY|nr:hypothetical protein M413DRAFT_372556 [Hebeloma cylindrosporum h7]